MGKKPSTNNNNVVNISTKLGFQAQLVNLIEDLPSKIDFPKSKHNLTYNIALLMFWKRIATMAERKYDALLAKMIEDKALMDPKAIKLAGDHVMGQSDTFTVNVNVSQPRKEFNLPWFCSQMQKKYKVPTATTMSLFEMSKQPGQSQQRRITISEKGVEA